MEKRALLAIALSVGILLAWQVWVGSPPPPEAPRPAPSVPPPAPGGAPGEGPRPASAPRAAADAATIAEVVSPLYRGSFAADGSVTAWTIEYRGSKRLALGGALRPLAVAVQRPGQAAEVVVLRPESPRLEVTSAQPTGRLSFSGTTMDGLRVRRTLEFHADSYLVKATLQLEGPAGRGGPVDVFMYWTTPVSEPGPTREDPWLTFGEGRNGQLLLGRILVDQPGMDLEVHEAPAPALRDAKETPNGPELKDPLIVPDAVLAGAHRWAALENDYFIAALIRPEAAFSRGRAKDVAHVGVVFRAVDVGAGRTWEATADLYVGPKEWVRLRALGRGAGRGAERGTTGGSCGCCSRCGGSACRSCGS